MTQASDLGAITNQSGALYRQRVNAVTQALASRHYGPTPPPAVYPNMEWYCSANGAIYQRDPANTQWFHIGWMGPPMEILNKGKQIVDELFVGAIVMSSQNYWWLEKPQWLPCDGRLVVRAQYPYLNAVYARDGYPYGAGDGVTNFALPWMSGRCPVGVGQGATGWGGQLGTARWLGYADGVETVPLSEANNGPHGHPYRIDQRENDSWSSNGTGGFPTGPATLQVPGWSGTPDASDAHIIGGSGLGLPHYNIAPQLALWFCVWAGPA